MNRLKGDSKLLGQVRAGTLDPQVAARQVHSPVLAKKLRGRARHLRRHAGAPPTPPKAPRVRPPSPRALEHARLTAAKPAPVPKHAPGCLYRLSQGRQPCDCAPAPREEPVP